MKNTEEFTAYLYIDQANSLEKELNKKYSTNFKINTK